METLWDKLTALRPSYLVVLYQGHIQKDAEKHGIAFQTEMRQYGPRCHIHDLDQPIPKDTDFVFCTYFTPGPVPDFEYYTLEYTVDESYHERIKAIDNNPPALFISRVNSRSELYETLIKKWANK